MQITAFDHLVLTVGDVEASARFYAALGMQVVRENGRCELHFNGQKINLHACPGQFQPAALRPTEGSADFCLVAHGPVEDVLALAQKAGGLVLGPVARQGARGAMTSVYLRDPDGNLVELCVYDA